MTDGVFTHIEPSRDFLRPEGVNDFADRMLAHDQLVTNYLSLVKTSDTPLRQKTCHAMLANMANSEKPFGDIAYRLKWHREVVEQLTQAAYAKKAGLKRPQLNNWESGDFRLSLDGALALRRTYGLSLDFMYEGIDDTLPMALRAAWRDRPLVSASR